MVTLLTPPLCSPLTVHAVPVEDSPLAPGEVYEPIIDELIHEFSQLVAKISKEVCDLPPRDRVALKMCVEETLKSKNNPVTVPTSAEDLLSTIRQYWSFLNLGLIALVVDCLDMEELRIRFKEYKKSVRRKTYKLLRYCKKQRIEPVKPPMCRSMRMTVDVDPHSYSLQRILDAKDFLERDMKIKVPLFAGWAESSIILHFYILEDDMETAVRRLKDHETRLRGMQVVAIEVDGVIIYQDTPSKRKSSITVVCNLVHCLADAFEVGGPIVSMLLEFGSAMVAVVGQVQAILQGIADAIKGILQVQTALNHVKSVVAVTYVFLDKVDDIIHYCQSESMAVAIQGLSCSPPDLKPLRDLISHLENSLSRAEAKYSEYVFASNTAISSCSTAEEVCAQREKESPNRRPARGINIAVVATAGATVAVLGVGMTASMVSGFFTLGIGAAVGMGLTVAAVHAIAGRRHHYASEYAENEAAFRRLCGDFDALGSCTYDLKEGLVEARTTVRDIAMHVNVIYHIDERSANWMRDSLKHLMEVCAASHDEFARCRRDVKSKAAELEAKLNRVYTD